MIIDYYLQLQVGIENQSKTSKISVNEKIGRLDGKIDRLDDNIHKEMNNIKSRIDEILHYLTRINS
jgi:hypothetical protein